MSSMIEINRSKRNTKAEWIYIGELSLLISYETVVAASCRDGDDRLRGRREVISRTTSKHLREMGADTWPETDEAGIEAIIHKGLIETGLSLLPEQWKKAAA